MLLSIYKATLSLLTCSCVKYILIFERDERLVPVSHDVRVREWDRENPESETGKTLGRTTKELASRGTWGQNMFGYLSLDIICSEKRTVFRERSSGKTVNFAKQIMSEDKTSNAKNKNPSIFSRQIEAIVFIILQIFFATHAVLKIGEYLTIRPVALEGERVYLF